jgi:hypothetical protein
LVCLQQNKKNMSDLRKEQIVYLENARAEISLETKKLAEDYKIKLLLDNDLEKITQEFADKETPKLVIIAEKYLHPNPTQIMDLRQRLISIVMEESLSACTNLINS